MTSPQIWLVEDEASIADTLIYSLETDGFAVRWFERGLPLLEAMHHEQPDFLILMSDCRISAASSSAAASAPSASCRCYS